MPHQEAVLRIENLSIQANENHRNILDQVSLQVERGEILALVGESGSGKSMTASAVIGLLPRGVKVTGGKLFFQGEDILPWKRKKRRRLAGRHIGYVFQDYRGSFSPYIPIGKQLIDVLQAHYRLTRKESREIVLEHLNKVSLPAERVFSSYSFQLSGGQVQRAALSAVLMLKPDVLIADEPTTALDVLTGETVIEVMEQIQAETGCAILLISHDLRLVLKRANRIAVMKEGRIVEMNTAEAIRDRAVHPYTRKLLDSCPKLERPMKPSKEWEEEKELSLKYG